MENEVVGVGLDDCSFRKRRETEDRRPETVTPNFRSPVFGLPSPFNILLAKPIIH